MHYKCVDGHGPNKRIQVDLIDIIENQQASTARQRSSDGLLDTSRGLADQSTASCAIKQSQAAGPKQRSLIYFKVHPTEADPSSGVESEAAEIRDMASFQKFSSFEQMYNKVTERLVARVLENEQLRQD